MTNHTSQKIGMATLIMMASVFLSRVIGFVREAAIAAVGGTELSVEAYKTAFVLPEILNHVLASGFLSITFIPIFARYLAIGDESAGWRAFSVIMTVFGLLLTVLLIVVIPAAPYLMPFLTPGRVDPAFATMTVRMTRIILPAQFFFFAGGLLMAVQFAKKQFFLPALSPLIYNAGIILGGLVLGPRLGMEGFSWGALAGAGLGSFALQLYGARKIGLRFQVCFNFSHPDLRRYILLTIPLAVGLTMIFSVEIFSKFFGSFLEPRAIAWIDYAWRIIMMLVAFFGQAVGVASYPFLASLAARNHIGEMNRLFNTTLRSLALVIPFAVFLLVCRNEVVLILFERSQFTGRDTRMTAAALGGMLIGAVAFSAQTVVNRGFYAMQNTWTPAIYGTAAVVICLPIYWWATTLYGVFGFGLAVSISSFLQAAWLFFIWNRRGKNREGRRVYFFYVKIILICLPIGFLLKLSHTVVSPYLAPGTLAGSIGLIALLSFIFISLLAIAFKVFDVKEALLLKNAALTHIRPHRRTGGPKNSLRP